MASHSGVDAAFSTSGDGGAVHNWGGRFGAWLADASFFLLGCSCWWCFAAGVRAWIASLARWMRVDHRPAEPEGHRWLHGRLAFWIGLAVLLLASTMLEWSRLYRFEARLPDQAGGALGYLVAPAPFIRKARAMRSLMLRHPPGHLQRTAAYFLALGHYDAVLHRMRTEYHKRHVLMAESLQREGLAVAGASAFGGTSFWMEGPQGLDADRLVQELRHDGVLVESGSPFFPRSNAPCRFFRMGYSSIPRENIPEGITRVRAGIDRLMQRPDASAQDGAPN